MTINGNRKLPKMLGVPKVKQCSGAVTIGYQNIKYKKQVNRKPVNAKIIQ